MRLSGKKLLKLCVEYDEVWGKWPESQYEGKALAFWILEKAGWSEARIEKALRDAGGKMWFPPLIGWKDSRPMTKAETDAAMDRIREDMK